MQLSDWLLVGRWERRGGNYKFVCSFRLMFRFLVVVFYSRGCFLPSQPAHPSLSVSLLKVNKQRCCSGSYDVTMSIVPPYFLVCVTRDWLTVLLLVGFFISWIFLIGNFTIYQQQQQQWHHQHTVDCEVNIITCIIIPLSWRRLWRHNPFHNCLSLFLSLAAWQGEVDLKLWNMADPHKNQTYYVEATK